MSMIIGIGLIVALVLAVLSWAPPWAERHLLAASVFVLITVVALSVFGKM